MAITQRANLDGHQSPEQKSWFLTKFVCSPESRPSFGRLVRRHRQIPIENVCMYTTLSIYDADYRLSIYIVVYTLAHIYIYIAPNVYVDMVDKCKCTQIIVNIFRIRTKLSFLLNRINHGKTPARRTYDVDVSARFGAIAEFRTNQPVKFDYDGRPANVICFRFYVYASEIITVLYSAGRLWNFQGIRPLHDVAPEVGVARRRGEQWKMRENGVFF